MNQQAQYEDEISLTDIITVISTFKKLIMLCTLIVGLMGLVVSLLIPPKWEAQAILQVGQVGQLEQLGQLGSSLELLTNVIVRMSVPSFSDRLFKDNAVAFSSLKVKKAKDAYLVEIALKAASSEQALKAIKIVSDDLITFHGKIFDEKVQVIKSNISEINNQIEMLTKSNNLLAFKAMGGSKEGVMDVFLLQQNMSKIYELNHRKDLLENSLDKSVSFNTHFVSEPYVSKAPVSPNKQLIVALSLLLGLFLGLFLAFFKNSQKLGK
jgi:capsular polysaccharide biosynthesis protein